MVAFDSTIPPGREGKITPQVVLKGLHGGDFTKSVTVESNASNEPSLVLSIKGTIVPVIEVGLSYLTVMNGAGADRNPMIVLKSRKKDLKVVDIVFEVGSGGPPGGWRSSVPILPTFELVPVKEVGVAGLFEFSLRLAVKAELTEPLNGSFRITTNHPQKTEINIPGRVSVDGK